MKVFQRIFPLAMLITVLVVPGASAEVIVLGSLKDNTLYESTSGSTSNGSGQYLFSGRVASIGGGTLRRGLIAFDIAGNVSAGSTINSVTLTLRMSRTRLSTQRATSLHRVLADWGEGASDALGQEGPGTLAATGDATWIHTFQNTGTWTNAGGDFDPAASASLGVGGFGFHTWGSSAGMVADVQLWLDQPADNFGWIIVGVENVLTTAKRFDSKENPTSANRPSLTIDFTTLPVFGACCNDLSGTCEEGIDQAVCLAGGGRFGGEDSTCVSMDPPCEVSGACCDDFFGQCADLVTQSECEVGGFRYGGDESTCLTIDPPCTPGKSECADRRTSVCNGASAIVNPCADTTPSGPLGSCTSGGGLNDVYIDFVATDANARIQTDAGGSIGTDSNFIVYAVDQGDICNPDSWVEVGCSEDDSVGNSPYLGDISIPTTSGDTYLIRAGTWSDTACGDYEYTVSCPTVGGICGDGIQSAAGDEECDGADTGSCLTTCEPDCTCTPVPTPMLPKSGLIGLALLLLAGGATVFGRSRRGSLQA